MGKISKILLELVPILIGIALAGIFWRISFLLAFVFLVAIIIIVRTNYKKGDYLALGIGLVIGLLVEIVGTYFVGYQSFAKPDFLGIPLWLPLAWAYGFMFMKRVGVIING